MFTRKLKIHAAHVTFLLDRDGLWYFSMILPEDRHDTVRQAVDMDLNTVRSHED